MPDDIKLPPLPEPAGQIGEYADEMGDAYDMGQMLDYARAAVLADREGREPIPGNDATGFPYPALEAGVAHPVHGYTRKQVESYAHLIVGRVLVGLSQRNSFPIGSVVDKSVPVAAARAQEIASSVVNLGSDGSEHDVQPAASASPHGTTSDGLSGQDTAIREEISRMLSDGLVEMRADGTVGLTRAGRPYAEARDLAYSDAQRAKGDA